MKPQLKKIIIVILTGVFLLGLILWVLYRTGQPSNELAQQNDENLFPFGEINEGGGSLSINNQGSLGSEDEQFQQNTNSDITNSLPSLRLVSSRPTGGMVALSRIEQQEITDVVIDEDNIPTQQTRIIDLENSFIRYSDIENGNIYEMKMTGENAFKEERIIENFIPNTEEVFFSKNGEQVLFQYWDNTQRIPESYLGNIQALSPVVEVCPYQFNSVEQGQENDNVFNLHKFFNQDKRTQMETSGVNSPGNESSLATEKTIESIKKFQRIYKLSEDGTVGAQTRLTMLEVCNKNQEKIARELFEQADVKYQINGYFLPRPIVSASMSPSNNELFYLEKNTNGVSGIVRNLVDQSTRTIFVSPFSEWTSSWYNQDKIEITTKPSYLSLGYSYELDTVSGEYHKSLSESLGLMVLPSHNNKKLLVYAVENGNINLSVYDRETQQQKSLTIETFTDKCTWSLNNEDIYCGVPNSFSFGNRYPDTWYQGLERYQDSLYKINTRTGEEILLSNLFEDYNQTIDVEKIHIDDTDRYLYFIEKNTEELWSYRIDEL